MKGADGVGAGCEDQVWAGRCRQMVVGMSPCGTEQQWGPSQFQYREPAMGKGWEKAL